MKRDPSPNAEKRNTERETAKWALKTRCLRVCLQVRELPGNPPFAATCAEQPPRTLTTLQRRAWWLVIRLIRANVSKQGAKPRRTIYCAPVLCSLFIGLRVIRGKNNILLVLFAALVLITFSRRSHTAGHILLQNNGLIADQFNMPARTKLSSQFL